MPTFDMRMLDEKYEKEHPFLANTDNIVVHCHERLIDTVVAAINYYSIIQPKVYRNSNHKRAIADLEKSIDNNEYAYIIQFPKGAGVHILNKKEDIINYLNSYFPMDKSLFKIVVERDDFVSHYSTSIRMEPKNSYFEQLGPYRDLDYRIGIRDLDYTYILYCYLYNWEMYEDPEWSYFISDMSFARHIDDILIAEGDEKEVEKLREITREAVYALHRNGFEIELLNFDEGEIEPPEAAE